MGRLFDQIVGDLERAALDVEEARLVAAWVNEAARTNCSGAADAPQAPTDAATESAAA